MKYQVSIARELVEPMLVPGYEVRARCLTGLPSGAILVDASWQKVGLVVLVFEVVDGVDGLTVLTPTFERIEDERDYRRERA